MAVEWKRIAYALPRITAVASGATITPNADTTDLVDITALAEDTVIAAPTGTPRDGQKLIIRILDDGTSRGITWNAIYNSDYLPAATVTSEIFYAACFYNAASEKWDVAVDVYIGLFEIDINGGLMPVTDTNVDVFYELDANDDIMPRVA